MAAGDRWVESAMAEDSLVAELLMRLHNASPSPSSTPSPVPHLEWSVRQRRSKSVAVNEKRKRVSLLGSPTTPLSWSGANSASAGSVSGSGSEESSQSAAQDISGATRSKISSDSERNNSKKPRKKKTLAELKDEESSLLKERRVLKREMAAMRLNLEKQRVQNDNIKKVKVELLPCVDGTSMSTTHEESFSCHDQHHFTDGHHPLPTMMIQDNKFLEPQPSSYGKEDSNMVSGPKFVLPDLNIPCDYPTLDVVCEVS